MGVYFFFWGTLGVALKGPSWRFPSFERHPYGCGSKSRYQNGTLVSGNMDQNLRTPSCLISRDTHISPTSDCKTETTHQRNPSRLTIALQKRGAAAEWYGPPDESEEHVLVPSLRGQAMVPSKTISHCGWTKSISHHPTISGMMTLL